MATKKKGTVAKVKSGLKSAVKATNKSVVQPVAKALGLAGKKKSTRKSGGKRKSTSKK